LKEHTKNADIILVGVGKPKLITEDMVSPNSIIIDIGINKIKDIKSGKYNIVGDVDYYNIVDKVKMITPVPGCIGPMTIAILIKHTIKSAFIASNIEKK
jgi:5,10-methylene-tetrahydrofolate dehydrogenase/methenyl tetrahydrofolate cyclohydrolase